jgi:rhodanese-related sulfurtransferase
VSVPTVDVSGVPDPLPDELTVLDVREDFEWQAGHIDGALHVPLGELPDRLTEVGDGQTLIVCRSGGRSGQAVAWLAEQGYDVVNLEGGMHDWADAGRPMVSESGAPPRVA